MGRNRLTYFIDGREAVPVRAIPYVTGWMQSPDELAGDLAMRVGAPFSVLRDISALHLHGAAVTKVLPKEWDAVVTTLKALEARLKKSDGEDEEGYAVWRQESVKALPAGVFLWRDEFEAELQRRTIERDVTLARPRPGDSDVNYEPMIAPDVWALVIEGFRICQYEQQEAEKRAAGRYTLKEAARLVADGCGERFESVLAALRASVLSGDLKTYNPGRTLKVTYGKQSGQNSAICDYYEEVVWSEVNDWIAKNGLQGFRFPAPADAPVGAPNEKLSALQTRQKTKRQQWNEDIVKALLALGRKPKSLPRGEPGKPGVRAEVASKLGCNTKSKTFEHAWDNALSDNVIAYRE